MSRSKLATGNNYAQWHADIENVFTQALTQRSS
jgi:hypothetical protein